MKLINALDMYFQNNKRNIGILQRMSNGELLDFLINKKYK